MRGSFYDDTESNHNGKSETFPRVMPTKIKTNRASQKAEAIVSSAASRESIRPMSRPRTSPIQREDSGLKLQKDTFPESEIPSGDHEEEEEEDGDSEESDNSGVTYEKIARHFANRPETFSESLQAHHGSWKKKDRAHYENVDLTLNEMRKT